MTTKEYLDLHVDPLLDTIRQAMAKAFEAGRDQIERSEATDEEISEVIQKCIGRVLE